MAGRRQRREELDNVNTLLKDIRDYVPKLKIPEKLNMTHWSERETLHMWFTALAAAVHSKPLVESYKDAQDLLMNSLHGLHSLHRQDIKSFFDIYKIPHPSELTGAPDTTVFLPEETLLALYGLTSIPVEAVDVGDGDGFIAFVKVNSLLNVPENVIHYLHDRDRHLKNKRPDLAKIAEQKLVNTSRGVYGLHEDVDGDIHLVRKYRIRLRAIDAPEMKQPFGPKAQEILRGLIENQQVTFNVFTADRYFRSIADVYCGGKSIQESLVEAGAAWHYELCGYDNHNRLKKLMQHAVNNGLGLWSFGRYKPMAPWTWKDYIRRGIDPKTRFVLRSPKKPKIPRRRGG